MKTIKKIKKNINYRDLGGKEFEIEIRLTPKDVLEKYEEGNWSCYNFVQRRPDFRYGFNKKIYYGKVGALGYVICEDELEE